MRFCYHLRLLVLCMVVSVAGVPVFSQITIRGTVFDITKKRPLEGVSVMSTSGAGTSTDVLGKYAIRVHLDDSIYFSYLDKPTTKFPVRQMVAANNFDISLHVESNILPEIFVRPPSYRLDSIQNRRDYAKVFDFRKPGVKISSTSPESGNMGVGFDATELINVFRFKRNKSMLAFRERLEQEERDKFIDHRFSKAIVKKISGLEGDDLAMFMKMYRPSYEFTALTSDYEFYENIKENAEKFKAVFLKNR